jgi:2-isopropylmalate synthase
VRKLIVENRIPDDVTIIVLTQSREELIRRTVESLEGAKKAIVHLYNSVAPAFRKIVFNMSREEIKNIAVTGTKPGQGTDRCAPGTEWRFEYSPESFSTTELDFSKDICDAVCETWGATPAQDHPQPALHRGVRHPQRLRRPDRMDVPQPEAPRQRHHLGAPAQ